MSFAFTPLAALSGLASLLAAAISIIAWNRRQFAGVRWLALLMASVAFWAGGAMCELSVTSIGAKLFWSKVEYLGTLSTPVLFLLLALDYNHISLRRRWLALLFAIPVLCLLLAASNDHHRLIWTSVRPSPSGYNLLIYGHGPAFWLGVAGYSYLMMLLGSLLLIRALHYFPPHFRGQSITLMLSAIAPWFGNILYLSGAFPLQGLDPTPHSFAFTGMIFAIDLLYLRQLYLVPVARARAFEAMGDGVVVVDHQLRILDINPAGSDMLGDKPAPWHGCELPAPWLRAGMLSGGPQLELMTPDGDRILDIRVYEIQPFRKPALTRMLVMRDITLRRQTEDALRDANLQLTDRLAQIEALQAALREQTLRDPLTQLFNRRYLDETFERERERAERESQPIAVAMLDLDDFKRINDLHGHQVGDAVLQALAWLLKQQCRAADIVCRLGGEEFMVVLPGSDAEQAQQRAEIWRRRFHRIEHQGSGDQTFRASFSCGIAALPDHGSDLEQLYRRADQALYQAKAAGKNRSARAAR
ncbi:hypothetical protein DK842_12340 [Chromobacterium phragmitis]|uniref:histidine kinase N-terminal 7TM domain-containing protein n=1 Tax=Chromobacterium phragmitis TaxID=2202141 RepID=UPI000DEC9E13|nr:histidine kinase N-terminal 7TM domain-containing protein [Chromobacterium phragmitis]AXE30624.1 hypothetical protein DK842_12340 [Chromobacterium phragmitis]